MPSTASSNTGLTSTSNSAYNSGTNSSVVSPLPPVSLSNTITNMSPSASNTIAGEDSDYSDFGQQQPSTSNSRSRQKKFLKNFKGRETQEEVVLQRKYSLPS